MAVSDIVDKPALLKGDVIMQFVRCGKSNCHCSTGELHGPYYYRVWRDGEKIRKQYVRSEDVPAVREACRAYVEARNALKQHQQAQQALQRSIRRSWQATRKAINTCASTRSVSR
jgi:hypothetical protein